MSPRSSESLAKGLLDQAKVQIPEGATVASLDEALELVRDRGWERVVVKADSTALGSGRMKAGGVKIVDDIQDLPEAFADVMGAFAPPILVERFVPHDREMFVSMDLLHPEGPSVLASPVGGIDVEHSTSLIRRTSLRRGALGAHHIRYVTEVLGLEGSMEADVGDVLRGMHAIIFSGRADSLEINPLVIEDGHLVVLDAKISLDPSQPDVESEIGTLDEIAEFKRMGADLIDIGPGIGIVGLGAGLSMYIVDRIHGSGESAGFICDPTRAAVEDWAALYEGRSGSSLEKCFRRAFELARSRSACVLCNLTSGGTPVDGLAVTASAATDVLDPGSVIFNVSGYRSQQGRELLESRGHRVAADLTTAIKEVVSLAREGA